MHHGLAVALDMIDERVPAKPLRLRFVGTLTPAQHQAARALLASDCGVLVAPPGFGKTVIGAYLVAARGRNTLVPVHRKPLLDQWRAQLAVVLGAVAKLTSSCRRRLKKWYHFLSVSQPRTS
jgi:superfamily II DNA or RNA helicase